jgi:zinc transport system substrate-binding protein
MYRIVRFLLIIIVILCVLPMICLAAGKLPVFVSIVPQHYFVQQIGKDLVDIQVMVQPAASPATYEPKPKQMVDLSKAKIYFAI